jgi:DMSO reductase anchor subunit
MHPAFSVIFFTTASGAGFGALAWLGLLAMSGVQPSSRVGIFVALALAVMLCAAGLISSLGHLGQPQRAWRAFSQWRSSWLSREGVFATLSFAPALWLAWLAWQGADADVGTRVAGLLLAFLSLGSVVCTAMIYASLKPIPAWRHPLVLPVYLTFALFTGGLLVLALAGNRLDGVPAAAGVVFGAILLAVLKLCTWRFVDTDRSLASRNSALGLPHSRPVQVFERPHTEANYLLKEMGYVLARKHARKLRLIALVLFALVPMLCAIPVLVAQPHGMLEAPMALALVSALAGALVERWLFFAEARHLVTLYY